MKETKKKYGKWIGGALGWAFGGPLGALFGFAVGSMFDGVETHPGTQTRYQDPHYQSSYRYQTTHDDFVMSLLALSAAIMKADGKSTKSELAFIRTFFTQQFGKEKSSEAMMLLKDLLKRDIPLRDVCEQIRYNMEHALRLQLLHYMFGIAKSDGHVHSSEARVIQQIAGYLGISSMDFESIQGTFYSDSKHAYQVLEINESASDQEVKKAYRKMANKFHPDKVSHLGDEFKNAAREKFIKVKDAYELIKKERGIN
jgi:DnaJ like chaperone protein